jgi:hypothetical protein
MSHAMGSGHDYVNAEEHGDELAFYLGKLDAAKARIDLLWTYATHKPGCRYTRVDTNATNIIRYPCDCGFAELCDERAK